MLIPTVAVHTVGYNGEGCGHHDDGELLAWEETIVFGDRGYHRKTGRLTSSKEGELSVLTPTKKPAGGTLTDEQKAFNRLLSAVGRSLSIRSAW